MSALKLGIIGYGGMGSYHAKKIIKDEKNVEVAGVFDIDKGRREIAEKDGFVVFESLEVLLANSDIQGVLIATPNDCHKSLAITALQAGKHVVCEKPVMLNVAELDEVLKVAEETGKTFMVHQNRRWDEDFLVIRNLYQNHQIGELFQIESRVEGANGIPGDWRHLKAHGGGMLLDWGVHLLDQILFLVESPLKSVAADLSFVLGDEVDDGFICYLTFESALKVIVEVGTSNFIQLPRWYVKGLEGTAVIYDWDINGKMVKQTGIAGDHHQLTPIKAGAGLTKTMAPPSEELTTTLLLPAGEAEYPGFYETLYQVVTQGKEPLVKNNEVRRVMVLIETIFKSAETGQVINWEE